MLGRLSAIPTWLGHADFGSTNRYAEINTRTKLAALHASEPHDASCDAGLTPRPVS